MKLGARNFFLSLSVRRTIEYTGKAAFFGMVYMLWYNLLGASTHVAKEYYPDALQNGLGIQFGNPNTTQLITGPQENPCFPVLKNFFSKHLEILPSLPNFKTQFPFIMEGKGFAYEYIGLLALAFATPIVLAEPAYMLGKVALSKLHSVRGHLNLNVDKSKGYNLFRGITMPVWLAFTASFILYQNPWIQVKNNMEIIGCMAGALAANAPGFSSGLPADMTHSAKAFLPNFISEPKVVLRMVAFLFIPNALALSSFAFEHFVTLGLAVKALYNRVSFSNPHASKSFCRYPEKLFSALTFWRKEFAGQQRTADVPLLFGDGVIDVEAEGGRHRGYGTAGKKAVVYEQHEHPAIETGSLNPSAAS